jgi:COP9 signalosome complex subunit 4
MKRQFLPAASKYLELSLVPELHSSEKTAALRASVTCCILAGAGPQRTKMMSTLYKDDRLSSDEFKEHGLFSILEKMVLSRVLQKKEVEEFSKSLMAHQLATLGDGSTVFDRFVSIHTQNNEKRAVMEHNLLSISKLFINISFQQMSTLLSVSPTQAEEIAASMISDGRLCATIDQVENLVHFQQPSPLESWNERITNVCLDIDEIVQDIAKKYPEWIKQKDILVV